ncbi:MAG: hypothetical protein AAF633_15125 [Chloroflexota bacterium]
MATKNEREIFSPYLEKEFNKRKAVTYGEKLAVIEEIIGETKNGKLPISPEQVIRLSADNPAVRAVREGRAISLDGEAGRVSGAEEARARRRSLMGAAALFSLFPIFFLVWWWSASGEPEVVVERPTTTPTITMTPIAPNTPTAIPTMTNTPEPTATVDPSEFAIVITPDPPEYSNIPIAMTFAGRDLRIQSATYQAEWQPSGVEWWPGTHVRRVFAMPYEVGLMDSLYEEMQQIVTIRLRNGATLQYQLNDLRRLNEYQIEVMTSQEPSIAIIMHGEEESTDRWVVIGDAIQEGIVPGMNDVVLSQIDFIEVSRCSGTGMTIRCEISFPEDEKEHLDQIAITDMEWINTGSRPPTTVISNSCMGGQCVAQISGIARSDNSAVLVYEPDDDGNKQAQLIPVEPQTN